jgi:hypothetical protein
LDTRNVIEVLSAVHVKVSITMAKAFHPVTPVQVFRSAEPVQVASIEGENAPAYLEWPKWKMYTDPIVVVTVVSAHDPPLVAGNEPQ